MKVKVLKAFAYAHDGVRVKHLQAGEEHEIKDAVLAGLIESGHVEDPRGKKAAPKAEPPKDPPKDAPKDEAKDPPKDEKAKA